MASFRSNRYRLRGRKDMIERKERKKKKKKRRRLILGAEAP